MSTDYRSLFPVPFSLIPVPCSLIPVPQSLFPNFLTPAPIKILFLPKYPKIGASSRLRTYQFLPGLEQDSHEVKISSFFNEAYLSRFYQGKKHHPLNVILCYVRRFWILVQVYRYNLIWIEKEIFPFLPSYAEWILNKLGIPYVVDYDDAVFHNYDQHGTWLVRTWMHNKIDWVMRHSALVTAGNSYLRQRALEAGAPRVELLPTVVDIRRYATKKEFKHQELVIGWIGSPTTEKYVLDLAPIFRSLSTVPGISLTLINAPGREIPDLGIPVRRIDWVEEEETAQLLYVDVGIMPLPDTPWEKGKCAYKLIQYMAAGLPVIASPVGMNTEVVQEGVNGFLASSPEEWKEAFLRLYHDPHLRLTLGQEGRRLVEQQFTQEKNLHQILRIIQSF